MATSASEGARAARSARNTAARRIRNEASRIAPFR